MPDLPKYIGIEGSHNDFESAGDTHAVGGWSQLIFGNKYEDASNNLNNSFAAANSSWTTDTNYPHISELYVRVRDVRPLVLVARETVDLLPDAEQVDMNEALERVEDIN